MLLRWSWGAGWRQVDAPGEGRQPQHEAPTPSLTNSGSKSTRPQAWAGVSPQLYLSIQEEAALTSRRQSPSLFVSSSPHTIHLPDLHSLPDYPRRQRLGRRRPSAPGLLPLAQGRGAGDKQCRETCASREARKWGGSVRRGKKQGERTARSRTLSLSVRRNSSCQGTELALEPWMPALAPHYPRCVTLKSHFKNTPAEPQFPPWKMARGLEPAWFQGHSLQDTAHPHLPPRPGFERRLAS